jgi:uncharacterized protein with NRDE domain
MCLILFAYRVLPDRPLVVAANRDEFYARPTEPAHRWRDAPHVFAGRDLEAGGTWLGVSADGRFAAVTNFSELSNGPTPPGSRGDLSREFLSGPVPAFEYARAIEGDRYQGFSLLLWDGDDLVYTSNRTPGPVVLPAGVHALANTHLDGTWPKTVRGKGILAMRLSQPFGTADLIELLSDATVPPDADLPMRGRDIEFERRVAPMFVAGADYGTRASTAVVFEPDTFTLPSRRTVRTAAARPRRDHAAVAPALLISPARPFRDRRRSGLPA